MSWNSDLTPQPAENKAHPSKQNGLPTAGWDVLPVTGSPWQWNGDYSALRTEREPPLPTDCPDECTCPPIFPRAMYCDSRRLKSIPQVPARMKYVYLQNNQIDAVPDGVFDNATDLVWVVLQWNKISSDKIGTNVFSKLTNLERVYLGHNNLTGIPFPLPNSLRELRVAGNKISKVQPNALEGLDNLTMLLLNDNQLEDIGGSLKVLKSLSYLDLSNNHLKKLPEVLPDSLHQLYLDFNQISVIPNEYFRQFPRLQYARMSNNELTDNGIPLNTFNVSSLIELDLSHNKLQKIPPVNENLENLYLHANKIKEFTVDSFCRTMGFMSFSKIQVLRLDGNSIEQDKIPQEMHQCLRQARIINI
ncbi:fibromodulin-like [Carcharodon carcharias]|uniref:fibromodulin-like n=1 Tax=Carcharodon carcharias TaxID=13397 RepID=UPI001B7DDDE0|nr:fibromodulin-like [Carcharodon carcharias]